MENLQTLAQEFKTKYESFITGCDAFELADKWDKDACGEMDVFYENELVSVILDLILSDRRIGGEEVRYLNDCFGFDYTADALREVYRSAPEEIGSYFETNFKDGYQRLRCVSDKLADAYRELFALICRIITLSDGVVTDEEKETIAAMTL